MNPVWTPDGKGLIFMSGVSVVSEKGMLAAVNADGSGQPAMLTAEEVTPVPTSVSPDGKFVIGVRSSNDQIRRGTDLFLHTIRKVRPLRVPAWGELAYQSHGEYMYW
jgi:Tol biopolymer transport system component